MKPDRLFRNYVFALLSLLLSQQLSAQVGRFTILNPQAGEQSVPTSFRYCWTQLNVPVKVFNGYTLRILDINGSLIQTISKTGITDTMGLSTGLVRDKKYIIYLEASYDDLLGSPTTRTHIDSFFTMKSTAPPAPSSNFATGVTTGTFNANTVLTAPPAPTLSSPGDGATVGATSPTFTWNASTGATSYRIQLSTSATFATLAYDSSGITGTSHTVQWLSGATQYYWHVYASNASGSSGPSLLRSFTTLAGPYLGHRLAIPGTIEAEYYDAGGELDTYHDVEAENLAVSDGSTFRTAEGVEVEPCQDSPGGGFNLAYTRPGEWLRYSVTVSQAGYYDIGARVASLAFPSRFHLELDGTDITGSIRFGDSGGWQTWITLRDTAILPAGDHFLYLKFDDTASQVGSCNVNRLEFTPLTVIVPPALVLVEGGTFQMGSASGGDADEKPVHTVTVSSFCLDNREVTVAEYRGFCTGTGRSMPSAPAWGGWVDTHPIVNVSWDDAKAYAQWVGKRLPTEAEWEYAARGGKFSHGYTYSGSNTLNDVGWNSLNSDSVTHPVGQKVPNELGLYDMSGNATEWCYDCFDTAYYKASPPNNPQGPTTGTPAGMRAKRGGSWLWGPYSSRVTDRSGFWQWSGLEDVGFRCAKDTTLAPLPLAPTNLTATAISPYQINLAWTDPSTTEDGFKVERAPGGTSTFAEIAVVGANVTSYQNTGLTPSTIYTYRIRAYNASGFSNYSNTATDTTQTQSITVTNPQVNANWSVGTQQQVTWTSSNVTGNVAIKLSTDGGNTFPDSLGSAPVSAGTAMITVPNTPSATCRVKVESSSYGTVYGISPGNFSVIVPSITVTGPLAGATWVVGDQKQVTWTSSNVTGNVTIKLSTDGGTIFSDSIGSAPVSAGTATITVPKDTSAKCRIKVVSASNGALYCLNPGNFSIVTPVTPVITVTAPLTGQNWVTGAQQQVTWTSSNVAGNVTIKLSTDGGSTFPVTLGTAAVGAGTATIIAPINPSATCQVMVQSVNNPSVYGINPGNFNIVLPPAKITVTAPTTGQIWKVGAQQQVTWTSQNATGNVTIKLSVDGGSTFPIILGSAPVGVGTATVAAPYNPSATCRIKVELASDGSVFGMNPGDFNIVVPVTPFITVTAPVNGQNWTKGTPAQVTWTSQYLTGNVNILLSTDGGTTFPINLGTAGVAVGSLNITVPNAPSTTCRVRVESLDSVGVYGLSPGNFNIVEQIVQDIHVTSPIAGAKWVTGSLQQVTWTSANVTGDVTVKLSIDGGSTYPVTLGMEAASTGNSTITVPNTLSPVCRVKVESINDGTVFGINPGTFSIVPVVHTLTVASINPESGVAVTVIPADNNSQADDLTQFTRQYNSGTSVTLTAVSTAGGNLFKKWLRGSVDYATTTSATVLMDADYTLAAVYVIPPPSAPTALAVTGLTYNSFVAVWTAVSGTSGYILDVSDDNFNSRLIDYSARDVGNVTQCQVTGLSPGRLYMFRVYAVNAGGRSPQASNIVTVKTYVQSYALGQPVSFPTHGSLTEYLSTDYQLVGIPGNSGKDVGTLLPGQRLDVWQVYWDNGQPANYYTEYQQGVSSFAASTGKAFWVLYKGNCTLGGTAAPALLDTGGAALIALTPGQKYNLITNPFDATVSWAGVLAANGLSPSSAIWSFDQRWYPASELQPYKGYLFDNAEGRAQLRVPYRLTLPGAVSKETETGDGWRVDIAVRSGKVQDRTTWFGVIPGSKSGKDDFEQNKPRHIPGTPDAFFEHPEWDPQYPEFATDIRPAVSDVEVWEMKVRSDARSALDVTFDGLSAVPAELAMYLLDDGTGRSVDLRKEATYTMAPLVGTRKLTVFVGKEELVKGRIAALLPHEFALLQNYPNPFNPSTTIPLVVPKTERVLLEIYNVLGQRVKRLVDESLGAGLYHIEWRGTNESGGTVASGVYYCIMRTATGLRFARTLVLLK
jgi:formylglycine-generating enzyme